MHKNFTHKLITVQAMAVIVNDAVAENGCVLFFIFRPFPLVTASLTVNNTDAVIAPGFDIIYIPIYIYIIIYRNNDNNNSTVY